jgi:hypothetical protein
MEIFDKQMETKLTKLVMLTIAVVNFTLATAQETPTTGVLQSDLLLNGKEVYRNYPKGNTSYKEWDKRAKLLSSYVDEEFGTLYEDKIKDSLIYRKGTNEKHKYIEFWWFELISPKDSIFFTTKSVAIRVGTSVEIIQEKFSDMGQLYQQEMKTEKNKEKEIQLYTPLWFHYYEDSKNFSQGSFQVYVQNAIITRITINFMTEGDMP